MCDTNFIECQNPKIEHFGRWDIFLQCQKCISGQTKSLNTCCISPQKIFVNLPKSDGKPTKREYCKNCGTISGLIKMNPANEFLGLPVITKQEQEALIKSRQKKRIDFYAYIQDLKQKSIQKEQQEFADKYHQYLTTQSWKLKRQKVLKRDQFICQACLETRATQVHHLTYDRVFKEPLFDLVSVCDNCHNSIHDLGE